jgi:hypothetical protein
MQQLSSSKDVVDALGGIAAVAAMTGRGYSAIAMWRMSGVMPANTYVLLKKELRSRGLSAPDSLWGMTEKETTS